MGVPFHSGTKLRSSPVLRKAMIWSGTGKLTVCLENSVPKTKYICSKRKATSRARRSPAAETTEKCGECTSTHSASLSLARQGIAIRRSALSRTAESGLARSMARSSGWEDQQVKLTSEPYLVPGATTKEKPLLREAFPPPSRRLVLVGRHTVVDQATNASGYRPNSCALLAARQAANTGTGSRGSGNDQHRFAHGTMLADDRLRIRGL